MLLEISIKNFALIDDITISFDNGFNVIMGETGSGKSNIIDSISILMGSRVQKDKIRSGCERAYITGAFSVDNNLLLNKLLRENDILVEDEPLIITREIFRQSSTVTKINNTMVSVAFLKEISPLLIDIYGQFENIKILSSKEQLNFIDNFGGENHLEEILIYQRTYKKITSIKEEINSFTRTPEEIKRDIDFYNYQINEIVDSNVLSFSEDELLESLKILENSQILDEYSINSINLLDNDEMGIISNLGRLSHLAENISSIDNKFSELANRINQSLIEIEDIKDEIYSYRQDIEYDEEKFKDLDDKRNILFSLKRKYGNTLSDINNYLLTSQERLNELLNYEAVISSKLDSLKKLTSNLKLSAKKLSDRRKDIAISLTEKIINQLKELDMIDSTFKININEGNFSLLGSDEINFLVSFNKNEPLKKFSEVASGGEISRFMLGIKSIEADKENIPTIIFDEIDTGISGNAGNIVGKKLKSLSNKHQVIVISHLPQIIAMADSQFLVYKDVVDKKTSSNIIKLNYEERATNLAKIIEGDNFSETTLRTAKEMIDNNRRGEI